MPGSGRSSAVPCPGCGVVLPPVDGPAHRYMESSPACWRLYGEVLAREYGDRAYWASHRLTVDAYAVQHPGRPSPRTIQSVAVHLIGLHLTLEKSASADYVVRVLRAAADVSDRFRWLPPPVSMGPITVVDVHAASDAGEHAARVRRWAESAWASWAPHHEMIRMWTPEGV